VGASSKGTAACPSVFYFFFGGFYGLFSTTGSILGATATGIFGVTKFTIC